MKVYTTAALAALLLQLVAEPAIPPLSGQGRHWGNIVDL